MIIENIKICNIKHITKKQIADLTGLSFDALSVRAKLDPHFPEVLFISNGSEPVYDKDDALDWMSAQDIEEVRGIARPREIKPVSEHGEYKPSPAMRMALERTTQLYKHAFITPQGIGNEFHRFN